MQKHYPENDWAVLKTKIKNSIENKTTDVNHPCDYAERRTPPEDKG